MADADPRHLRVSRELFLAAFGGANLGAFESWVTDRLTNLLEEEEVEMGQELYAIGQPPEFFYFMREGRVKLVREGSPPWIVGAPGVFGMDDALLERPRVRSAVALAHLQLMKIRVEDWLELLDDSFELARASVVGLARIVADYEVKVGAKQSVSPVAIPHATQSTSVRLSVIERLALLMDAPLLRGSGVQPLSDLAAASCEVSFETGETVFERASTRDKVFIVVDGEVEASRGDPELACRWGPGEIVCGAAALGAPALAWRATAVTPTRVITFRIEDWFDLMEEHFDMVRSALAALARRREELLDQLAVREGARLAPAPTDKPTVRRDGPTHAS